MAIVSINGLEFIEGDDRSISTQTLDLKFPAGVNTLTYDYLPSGFCDVTSVPPISAKIDGVNVLGQDFFVARGFWGTMDTIILVFRTDSDDQNSYFLAPLDGAAYPDFDVRGGAALFAEFGLLPFQNIRVESGPFRSGQPIGFDELENPSFDNNLRQGNQNANSIQGSGRADALIGMAGNDVLTGRDGADTILSGKGNDVAHGGADGDIILGFDGNDRLFGDGGRDALAGGHGRNFLTGGAGGDDFVFLGGGEVSTIKDFGTGDRLVLDLVLWDDSDLTTRQVVNRFGSVENGRVVLDFGPEADTTRIVIEDLDSLQGLSRRIFVIDESV